MAQAECTTPNQCKIIDTCCDCAAIPVSDSAPVCALNCSTKKCEAAAFTGPPACEAGRCVADFNCDSSTVVCLGPTPICQPGYVPLVAGACWQGQCVPAKECAFVDDCAACTATQACVFFGGGIMKRHCVDIPPECGGTASCACMGQSICGGVPCGGTGNQLDCQIP